MTEQLGKWLVVEEEPSPSGRTRVFALFPVGEVEEIGFVRWYSPWRKYALQPAPNTTFEADCLLAIAAFCTEKTRAHKAALAQAKRS